MKTDELTIRDIAMYLPCGLEIINSVGKRCQLTLSNASYHLEKGFKPLLRPLSDLTKEKLDKLFGFNEGSICDFEFSGLEDGDFYLEYVLFGIERIPCIAGYFQIQKLFENHYDINNLIGKGLAIDLNTVEK